MTYLVLSIVIALLVTIFFQNRIVPAILREVAIPAKFVSVANGIFVVIVFALSLVGIRSVSSGILYFIYFKEAEKLKDQVNELEAQRNDKEKLLDDLGKKKRDIQSDLDRLNQEKKGTQAELNGFNPQIPREILSKIKPTTPLSPAELICGTYTLNADQLAAHFGGHTWVGTTGNLKWQEYYAPHQYPSRDSPGTFYARGFRNQQQMPIWQGHWYLEGNSYCICTGTCEEYACREVKQEGSCTEVGESRVWWTMKESRKHSQITAMYSGDIYGLAH